MEPVLWDQYGEPWRFNPSDGFYYCECRDCREDGAVGEYGTLENLTAEGYGPFTATSPWIPRTYGRHSETRGLDEPAVTVAELLAREQKLPDAPPAEVA